MSTCQKERVFSPTLPTTTDLLHRLHKPNVKMIILHHTTHQKIHRGPKCVIIVPHVKSSVL
ncbi:ORF122 [White spot syndrome virus]|uniref:ORF122 n=1 Tax=White spot syndrome virus TaxID=342409 RepID=A0A2D3I754_9VIRU|nr:ORF122 [White spot syndrome virus]